MKTKHWVISVSGNILPINRMYLLMLNLILSSSAFAQKQVEHQQLLWVGYFNTLQFNEKWSLHTDVQERQFINPTAQHQLVFRSVVHRKLLENWSVAAGLTYFLQNPQNPESESNLTVPELRPNIGFENREKHSFFTITNRYRLEARFFHDVENNELVGGFRYSNLRLRYQLGFDVPILKKDKEDKVIVKVKDEIMFNIGNKIVQNFFDQNRIYLGLNYKLNNAFSVEAGYMNWFQQRSSGVDYYNRDIVRFSLFHTIKLKKK